LRQQHVEMIKGGEREDAYLRTRRCFGCLIEWSVRHLDWNRSGK